MRESWSIRAMSRWCLLKTSCRAGSASASWRVSSSNVQAELLAQLVLPLLDQTAGRDDQAALQVAAEHQLLDVEAGHDRLARAGVVGEQEAQRGSLDQLAVDGLDLVGERLKIARMHGEHRVEPARHPYPERLGGELELRRRRR